MLGEKCEGTVPPKDRVSGSLLNSQGSPSTSHHHVHHIHAHQQHSESPPPFASRSPHSRGRSVGPSHRTRGARADNCLGRAVPPFSIPPPPMRMLGWRGGCRTNGSAFEHKGVTPAARGRSPHDDDGRGGMPPVPQSAGSVCRHPLVAPLNVRSFVAQQPGGMTRPCIVGCKADD